MIYLNCREPGEDEVYSCTTFAPSYPHIIVTNSQLAEAISGGMLPLVEVSL